VLVHLVVTLYLAQLLLLVAVVVTLKEKITQFQAAALVVVLEHKEIILVV
jgi:hypothetical protein